MVNPWFATWLDATENGDGDPLSWPIAGTICLGFQLVPRSPTKPLTGPKLRIECLDLLAHPSQGRTLTGFPSNPVAGERPLPAKSQNSVEYVSLFLHQRLSWG